MKKIILGTFLFLLTLQANAKDFHFAVADYKKAEKSADYIRFDMKSTKLGMLTTGFTGFVKEFDVTSEPTPEGFKNTRIVFKAESLDTDVDARNEKMWDLCLDYKHHANLTIQFDDVLPLSAQATSVNGTLEVRGVKKPITLKLKSELVNGQYVIDGEGQMDIFELGLPDPSIFVAKVDPKLLFKFHLTVPQN